MISKNPILCSKSEIMAHSAMLRKQRTVATLAVTATRTNTGKGSADITVKYLHTHVRHGISVTISIEKHYAGYIQFSITGSIFRGFIAIIKTRHLHVNLPPGFLSLRKEEPLPELSPQTPVSGYSWPRRTQMADKVVSPSCFRSSLPSCPFSWCPLCHSFCPSLVFESCNVSRPSTLNDTRKTCFLILHQVANENGVTREKIRAVVLMYIP